MASPCPEGVPQNVTPTLYFNFTANEYLPIMPKCQADIIGTVLIQQGRWHPTDSIQALDLTQVSTIVASPLYRGASMITP